MSHVAKRREAIVAAIEAYNQAHPKAPLSRSASRLLAAMFASDDTCQLSLEALLDAVDISRHSAQTGVKALLAAGVIAKEESGRGPYPNRYRFLLALESGT